ncbi:MAG: PQQ-binding-like beta-propeller repeat protein [Planctomycetaceae bacterium]
MLRLAVSLVCLFSASVGRADHWSQFRGPAGDGHADTTGLPTKWSESENIVWKTPVRGRAWSSPVVWDNLVWMTSASEDGHELYAVCVDLQSGAVLHDFVLFEVAQPREIHKFNSYASPTPVIEAGRVYLSWGSYGLACLDSKTAELIWQRRDLECNHFRGPGSSPVLHGDLLILPYDGYDYQYVVAFDKRTGETRWKTNRPHNFGTDNGDQKKAYGTVQIIDVDGQQQLIAPTSKGAFAYDPATGAELWRVRYDGFSTAARPVYASGLLFLSTGFSKSELLAVDPRGSGDITATHVRWLENKAMPSKPSPLHINGRIYTIGDQGVANCLDAMTGEKVWQARVAGNYSASPVYADGKLYFASEEGKVSVVAPGDEFQLLAENELADGIMSSPAIADQSLLIRTKTHLYRIAQK